MAIMIAPAVAGKYVGRPIVARRPGAFSIYRGIPVQSAEMAEECYDPTPGELADYHAMVEADEAERGRILADYFQQLDWEHEYDREQVEIERHNREAGGWLGGHS